LPGGQKKALSGAKKRIRFYTDQELDTSTNLYNYDARLYDPVIGRFISPDSIVPDYFNPQSLNRYSYCLNNPLIYVDPTGHYANDPGEDPPDSGLEKDEKESKGDTVETNPDGLEGLNEDPFQVAGWKDIVKSIKNFVKGSVKTGAKGGAEGAATVIDVMDQIGNNPEEFINGVPEINGTRAMERQKAIDARDLSEIEKTWQKHADKTLNKK